MLTVKPLEIHYLDEAYKVELLAHAYPWTRSVFESNTGTRYQNLAVFLDDKLVAFCICQFILDEATLFNIAVSPTYQNQGIAKFLLEKLVEKLCMQKITHLWLEVRESNSIAIKLYEQMGFSEVDRRKNYYPKSKGREDALVMVKTLLLS